MSTTPATRVFRDLQTLARADYGGNTGALLVVYAVEGFLRRLSVSAYADRITLKGGMLMAALSARRMTRDADLSTVGVANNEAAISTVVAQIADMQLDRDDGLRFDTSTIKSEVVREDVEYHGVRVKLVAHLTTAQMTTTLDFSFGDPHRSTVIELPELLGSGTIRLASYPLEMVLAEKVATMMSRGELNTRDRDFADVWMLSRAHRIAASALRNALVEVATHRRHDLVPLARALADMPDRQAPYMAMLNRMAYQRELPPSWQELLDEVRDFVDPVVADEAAALVTWDPEAARWTTSGRIVNP